MQTNCTFTFVLLIPQAIAPGYNQVIVVMVPAVVFETSIWKCSTFAWTAVCSPLFSSSQMYYYHKVLHCKGWAHLRTWHVVHWFMVSPCLSGTVLPSLAAESHRKMDGTFHFYPFSGKRGKCLSSCFDAELFFCFCFFVFLWTMVSFNLQHKIDISRLYNTYSCVHCHLTFCSTVCNVHLLSHIKKKKHNSQQWS